MVDCGPLRSDDADDEPELVVTGADLAELTVLVEQLRRTGQQGRILALPADAKLQQVADWSALCERMDADVATAAGIPGPVLAERPGVDALIAAVDRDVAEQTVRILRDERDRLRAELLAAYRGATGEPAHPPVTDTEAITEQREAGLRLRHCRDLAAREARNVAEAMGGPARMAQRRATMARTSAATAVVALGIAAIMLIAGPGLFLTGALGVWLIIAVQAGRRAVHAHRGVETAHGRIDFAIERRDAADRAVTVAEAAYLLAGGDPDAALPVPVSQRTAARTNHRHGRSRPRHWL